MVVAIESILYINLLNILKNYYIYYYYSLSLHLRSHGRALPAGDRLSCGDRVEHEAPHLHPPLNLSVLPISAARLHVHPLGTNLNQTAGSGARVYLWERSYNCGDVLLGRALVAGDESRHILVNLAS